MAKKQYTPEEYKVKLEKKAEKNKKFSTTFLKVLAFCLAIVMVYCASSIAFTRTGMYSLGTGSVATGNNVSNGGESVDGDDDMFGGDNSNDAQAPSTDDSNNTVNDNSDNANNNSNNNAGSEDKPAADATNSNQEILDMYKKAVANARTKSKSVIRVKDGAINYKGIVEAGGLSDAAGSLMGMFMAENEAAIEEKNEPWEKEKLPDASALTLNGIKEIKRAEKGNTYIIKVVAKDAVNPKANADGVGSVAGVIEESQITGSISSVPGLKLSNINIAYENVTATATIDKATGNLIALDIDAPCILGLDAKLAFISVEDAKVGIQVITEYKIEY